MPNSEIARDAQVISRTLYSTQHGMRAVGACDRHFRGVSGFKSRLQTRRRPGPAGALDLVPGVSAFGQSFRFYTLLKKIEPGSNF